MAKPLKARMFPNRKEARRVRVMLERGTPLARLREEIDASEHEGIWDNFRVRVGQPTTGKKDRDP